MGSLPWGTAMFFVSYNRDACRAYDRWCHTNGYNIDSLFKPGPVDVDSSCCALMIYIDIYIFTYVMYVGRI